MNISNCKEDQVVEINIGGEILRTKVTPIVKSNIIHTEAYLRVMDQLSDYLKNNPGIQQLMIWLGEMKRKVVETAKGKMRARGPFRIPISLEGVSTWMKVNGLRSRNIQTQASVGTIEAGSELFK